MNRITRNSKVVVISGRDKGKQGSVIEILPKSNKVKIKDVAVLVKHVKARREGQVSGIIKAESFIDMSKVMPLCNNCKKPTVPKLKLVDNRKRLVCKRCNEII